LLDEAFARSLRPLQPVNRLIGDEVEELAARRLEHVFDLTITDALELHLTVIERRNVDLAALGRAAHLQQALF